MADRPIISDESAKEMRRRADAFAPKLFSPFDNSGREELFRGLMPKGGSLAPRRVAYGFAGNMPDGMSSYGPSGGGSAMYHMMRPYIPDLECFIEGTPLNMADGSYKPVEEVKKGDKIIDKLGNIQTVEKQWCSGIPDELVEITSLGDKKFYTTKEHKWPVFAWVRTCQCGCGEEVTPGRLYVSNHKRGKSGVPRKHMHGGKSGTCSAYKCIPTDYDPIKKIRSDEIRVDDFLLMPRKFSLMDCSCVSEDDARLLGYYVSEGNSDYNKYGKLYSVTFTFGRHEKNTLAKDASNIVNNHGISTCVKVRKKKNICKVSLRNDLGKNTKNTDILTNWLVDNGGELAHNKKLSSDVLGWSISLKRELIKGLFRGDGHQRWSLSKKKKHEGCTFHTVYSTISNTLIHQVQLILAQLGFPSRITTLNARDRVMKGKVVHCKTLYQVYVSAPYSFDLADMVWGRKSQSKRYPHKNSYPSVFMMDDDFVYFVVKSICIVNNTKKVYNVTVSGDHSYLANNIATYNSPDRQQYPRNRILANRYFRLFYEYDPLFGCAMDMYADMMVSDYDIDVREDSSKEIKDTFENMCNDLRLVEKMKQMIIEYMVVGETVPQLFYDDERRVWSYLSFHNQDYIEVKDIPLVDMEPIIFFTPDDNTRSMILDNSPESMEFRRRLPSEFVSKVLAKQKIRLSSTNCSFIARKLHPYSLRGTSIASRLWRIFMVEDAVYNSTIAMFRRHACFVGGTKVLTNNGIRVIEDIRVGDTVVSGDGKYKKVLAAWSEEADEIMEIKATGNEILECTTNHRFKIWARPRKCACGCGRDLNTSSYGSPRFFISSHDAVRDKKNGRFYREQREWNILSNYPKIKVLSDYNPIQVYNAEDIRKGDFFLIPRKFEQSDITVTKKDLLMARLLGYYVAEGGERKLNRNRKRLLAGEHGVVWTFGLHEYDTWAEDVVRIGRELGVNIRKNKTKKRKGNRVGRTVLYMDNVGDLWLASWLFANGGKGSLNKSLSQEVMSWPLEMKKELLIGMYRGDGHNDKGGEYVVYVSVSKSLVYQVRIILAQLGIFGSINKLKRKKKNWNDGYSVISCGEDNRVLRKIIWNDNRKIVKKISGKIMHGRSGSRTWMDENYIYVPVMSVKKRRKKSTVYNMTVEGDHSYIANGVATLNSPIKVLKIGDPATGWIPSPGTEQKLLEMLSRAEMDPNAWLCWNYAIQFEAWGTGDRTVTISKEHDTIEKVKLLGLGLAKSFMSGEVTYSSAKSGLQVFLRRLLSMRQFFENTWLYPKLFQPISIINKFVKAKPNEISHGYRVRRTSKEILENNSYIVPELRWKNNLDPKVDNDLLSAYGNLDKLGIKISKSTICSSVGVDWENELTKSMKEFKTEEERKDAELGEALKNKYEEAGGEKKSPPRPPGGAGGGSMPPGAKTPKGDASHPPGSASPEKGPSTEAPEKPDMGEAGGEI